MYSRAVRQMLARFGRRCFILTPDGEKRIEVKALLNPLLYKTKQYIGGEYLPDGFFDGGHYLYVGDGKIRIDNLPIGTVIECGEDRYVIVRAEQYIIGEDVIYTWAVLQLAEKCDTGCIGD